MKKVKYTIAIILAVSIIFIAISNVQGRNTSNPEDTVINFTEAYQCFDWEKAVNYLHPNVINNLRDQIVNIIKKVKKSELKDVLSEFGADTLAELEKCSQENFM